MYFVCLLVPFHGHIFLLIVRTSVFIGIVWWLFANIVSEAVCDRFCRVPMSPNLYLTNSCQNIYFENVLWSSCNVPKGVKEKQSFIIVTQLGNDAYIEVLKFAPEDYRQEMHAKILNTKKILCFSMHSTIFYGQQYFPALHQSCIMKQTL